MIIEHIDVLRKVSLFQNIIPEELERLLSCFGASVKTYKNETAVVMTGDRISHVGVVLAGTVQIQKEDVNGNRNILAVLGEADIFGEVFACIGIEKSPVNVIANKGSAVMYIDFRSIITTCPTGCEFHTRLIENMLRLIAYKNLSLSDKVTCLGHRSTQEKVEAFLQLQMERSGTNPFEIQFTRVEMADYLCVDRSAMSAVLSRMRDEGLIKFSKNKFELIGI